MDIGQKGPIRTPQTLAAKKSTAIKIQLFINEICGSFRPTSAVCIIYYGIV